MPVIANDPFAMLMECHGRIRSFTALALAIARIPADDREVARSAEELHRYFTVAFPLHVEDEEEALVHALEKHAPRDTWGALFDQLEAEHAAVDAELARLAPAWQHVARAPSQLPRCKADLERGSMALERVMLPHLATEEDRLFPLARRYLSREAQMELFADFRARRSLPS